MAGTTPEYDLLAKTLILGESGVGKTCIWHRYSSDQYLPDYRSTIGVEFLVKTIEVAQKKIKLQIWDTCGQERFRAISRSHYRGARGVMLCYAINNRESFEKIGYWMEESKRNNTIENACFIIVGTKSDLSSERVVSFDEGRKLAESYGLKFFETSAKKGVNINEAFLSLAKDMCEVKIKEKKKTQEVGTQLNQTENNPRIQITCFKCS